MPSASHSAASTHTTAQATARDWISANTRSRAFGVSNLESANPGISPRRSRAQDHRSGHEWPGAGAPSGLVGTRDQVETSPPQ